MASFIFAAFQGKGTGAGRAASLSHGQSECELDALETSMLQ
jgi:hypothetical protein